MAKRKRHEQPTFHTNREKSATQPTKKVKPTSASSLKSINTTPSTAIVKSARIAPANANRENKDKNQSAIEPVATDNSYSDSISNITIQIIAGSYDRVLHGITTTIRLGSRRSATIKSEEKGKNENTKNNDSIKIDFADSFLFVAHTAAIKALALSSPSVTFPGGQQGQKVLLASGSTDERINVYNLSAHPPRIKTLKNGKNDMEEISSLARRPIREDLRNREVGVLLHHTGPVTQLAFPTRGKLLSCGEDGTIGVTRTRDWNLLSSIKVPRPKLGTSGEGGVATGGVSGFAVHPSMKVLLSTSRGEKGMRLWNLVTGKKGGMLNFGKDVLGEIGEIGLGRGEASSVVFGTRRKTDGERNQEEEFAIVFSREVVVYGMDSMPRCRILGSNRTAVHRVRYLTLDETTGESLLVVSTGDGKVIFVDTEEEALVEPTPESEKIRRARQIAHVGGKGAGVNTRIKDFEMLEVNEEGEKILLLVTAATDGVIRVWRLRKENLMAAKEKSRQQKLKLKEGLTEGIHVGEMLGVYETENRITCLVAFVMIPRPEGLQDSDDEYEDEENEKEGSESEDDDKSDDE